MMDFIIPGGAVAVNASIGLPGNNDFNVDRFENSVRNSWPLNNNIKHARHHSNHGSIFIGPCSKQHNNQGHKYSIYKKGAKPMQQVIWWAGLGIDLWHTVSDVYLFKLTKMDKYLNI